MVKNDKKWREIVIITVNVPTGAKFQRFALKLWQCKTYSYSFLTYFYEFLVIFDDFYTIFNTFRVVSECFRCVSPVETIVEMCRQWEVGGFNGFQPFRTIFTLFRTIFTLFSGVLRSFELYIYNVNSIYDFL